MSATVQDIRKARQMRGEYYETPKPELCEFCRERTVKTVTALHFGRKIRYIHTCIGCNLKLTQEQERVEEAKREAAAEKRRARRGL